MHCVMVLALARIRTLPCCVGIVEHRSFVAGFGAAIVQETCTVS